MNQFNRIEIKALLEEFKAFGIKHSHQKDAHDDVMSLIELSPNVDIITLVGPTGVGKTRLLESIVKEVTDSCASAMHKDANHVPVIYTCARATGYRLFDWRLLYSSALMELGDPFADVRKAKAGTQDDVSRFKHAGESRTAAELRLRLEHELQGRGTLLWLIDEAQHLVFGGKSGHPGDQFDVLKSISQCTGIKILLSGPGELEIKMGTSGQLARRSSCVQFSRYGANDHKHQKTFASVAHSLLKQMKVDAHPPVTEISKMLYTGSAGCVGILKDWLARAYAKTLQHPDESGKFGLTIDTLRETRLKAAKMQTIMADIRRHEEFALHDESDDVFEEIVLGPLASGLNHSGSNNDRQIPKTTTRRVGVRLPQRDPVAHQSSDSQGVLL